MILYLDTSALVKLYVREEQSSQVARAVEVAETVATSRVAYPEARAALARRHREGAFGARGLRSAVRALDRDFGTLVVVELSDPVARAAGVLSESRALRGFDAIHLASAISLRDALSEIPMFLAYDSKLQGAAIAEGLVSAHQ